MSTGAAFRGALRSCSVASSSRLAHRDLLGARLSPVALGKRPEVWTINQRRHLSWLPWKSSDPVPKAESPFEPAVSASQQPSPPDLLPDGALPAAPSSSTPLSSASDPTPLPSLDTSTIPDPSVAETVIQPGTTLSEVIAANSHLPLKEILTSPEAIQAQASAADLASVGLGHGWISLSGWARDLLVNFHTFTGLPWWANIIALNILIRLLLVNMLIPSIKHNARWAASMPEQQAVQKKISAAAKEGDREAQLRATMELRSVWQKNDVSVLGLFKMPFVQMATFFTFFVSIRSLANTPWPQFLTGGFGWIQDLSVPDPYYILPVTSMICTVAVIRTGADMNARQTPNPDPKAMGKHFKNIFTVLSPFFLITASQFPAALTLFWTVSNAYSLLQAHIVKTPLVKRWLGSEHVEREPPREPTMRESFDAVLDWAAGQRAEIDKRVANRNHVGGQSTNGAQPKSVEMIIESPKQPRIASTPVTKPKLMAPPVKGRQTAQKSGKATQER